MIVPSLPTNDQLLIMMLLLLLLMIRLKVLFLKSFGVKYKEQKINKILRRQLESTGVEIVDSLKQHNNNKKLNIEVLIKKFLVDVDVALVARFFSCCANLFIVSVSLKNIYIYVANCFSARRN